jgi:hypothetical protein
VNLKRDIARALADTPARAFRCEEDKVIVVSEKRKESSVPYGDSE